MSVVCFADVRVDHIYIRGRESSRPTSSYFFQGHIFFLNKTICRTETLSSSYSAIVSCTRVLIAQQEAFSEQL